MHQRKSLCLFALLAAVCLLLCACPSTLKTVVFQTEEGTELCRATYKEGESEPTFSAPEKDGMTFAEWTLVFSNDNLKVYRASYAEIPAPDEYPIILDNGITVLGGTAGIDGQNCKNLFDGDASTRWCVDMNSNARAYVEWSTQEPVEVHGIWITTAENSSMNPQAWRVSCSTDGQNWEQLYQATSENNIVKEANLWRGIGIVFYVQETGEAFTKTAQYFRLEVDQTRGNSLLKIADFGITTDAPSQDSGDTETPPPDKYPMTLDNGITVSTGTTGVDGQDCENLFDGDDNTYWCVDMDENGRAYVEWSTPETVEIYGFDIFTAEDSTMNPQVLKVSGSADGQNWVDYWSFTSENNPIQDAQTFYRRGITFYTGAGDDFYEYVPKAQHFRLEIESTQGNSMLKLRAFGVITEPPESEEAAE